MNAPLPSLPGGFPGCPQTPAPVPTFNLAGFHAPPASAVRAAGEIRQSRVLVVVEPGFAGPSVDEILRREHREVMVDSTRHAVIQRVKSEKVDAVVLCGNQSGGRVMDLLNRITLGNPGLPVIVVTNPKPATARSLPQYLDDPVAPPVFDAELLLRSVREALTEPKVKRLIRLTGRHGEPKFVARNARWLSEDLQARYSMPFHWTQSDLPVPLQIENVTPSSL